MSLIFISHSSRDAKVAKKIHKRLKKWGYHDLFLSSHPEEGISAGDDWEQRIYSQIRSCRAVVILCSEASMASKWCFAEIAYARSLFRRIFPIRIGKCELHPALREPEIVNLQVDPDTAYRKLKRGLIDAKLDPTKLYQWDRTRSPYPGLKAFQHEDAAIYFGRDRTLQKVRNSLDGLREFGGDPLVLLLGPSGSGKSSLVRAGLLPWLERFPDEWIVTPPFRPLDNAFRQLAQAIAGGKGAKKLEKRLRADPAELANHARRLRRRGVPDAKLLVTVDQFEELLGAKTHTNFLRFLREATTDPDGPVVVLGTMRSDFLGEFQTHPELAEARFGELTVPTMSTENFKEIITGPAEVHGISLEPGLADRMAADTGSRDALPLLAYTLRQLWRQHGDDEHLTIEEYESIGGLKGSVARAAERVFRKHSGKGKASDKDLRDAFLKMVRINTEQQFVKQRVPWADFRKRVRPWLRAFEKARLLVSDQTEKKPVLEVAHEAILRTWKRLVEWLDEGRYFVLFHQRLVDQCERWKQRNQDDGLLLRGGPLEEAESCMEDLGPEERRFVLCSIERRDEEERDRQEMVDRARKIQQLSDWKRLEDLKAAADELWPAIPGQKKAYRDWLAGAGDLLGGLEDHRTTLDLLGSRPEEGDKWWSETLGQLVEELEGLRDPVKGLIDGIDSEHGLGISRRLENASGIRERSVSGQEARGLWKRTIDSVTADGRFSGLDLRPQLGLLPLGPDPHSGLQEFVHVPSGEVPARRSEDKSLAFDERSGIVLVLLPGGEFWIGAQKESRTRENYDPDAEVDEEPVCVTLDPFFISKYQMTQGQWLRFTSCNPSRHREEKSSDRSTFTDLHPVEQVSWNDCARVLFRLGLILPTEAQWEYAARAGTKWPWWTGPEENSLEGKANLADRSYLEWGALRDTPIVAWSDGYPLHAPVNEFEPNPFGLHSVHGNVWEWCRDEYGFSRRNLGKRDGLQESPDLKAKIFRGGSFYRGPISARSALRRKNDPEHRIDYLGLRPARTLDQE
jgi:formylglycine-generating enzyme required for sulfatase activity